MVPLDSVGHSWCTVKLRICHVHASWSTESWILPTALFVESWASQGIIGNSTNLNKYITINSYNLSHPSDYLCVVCRVLRRSDERGESKRLESHAWSPDTGRKPFGPIGLPACTSRYQSPCSRRPLWGGDRNLARGSCAHVGRIKCWLYTKESILSNHVSPLRAVSYRFVPLGLLYASRN
jgi:hypothetical protein